MIHWQALFFGLTQGFVVGPIMLYSIQEGLDPKKGIWFQVQVILGATVVEVAYLVFATYGAAHFIEYQWVRLLMWCLASYMLTTMGLNSLRGRSSRLSAHRVHRHKLHFYEEDFFKGALLNLFNPLGMVFWIVVAGGMFASYAEQVSPGSFIFSIELGGAISGIAIVTMTWFVRRIFHQWMVTKLVQAGALVLVAYGIFFSWKAFMEALPLVVAFVHF